ncbi:MAG: hypothetical protein AB7U79_03640 [Candidatus Izemoplasmatales bacterium]
MKILNNRYFQILLVVVVMVIIIVVSWTATPAVSDMITIATAILGFLIILVQLNRDHKIKKAEFIYNLNENFSDDGDIHQIYMKLKEYRDDKSVEFTPADGRLMGNYVMFFMILEYLLSEGLVTLQMIDSIFANKFFIFCNNPYVYQYQTKELKINYPLLRLYEKWYNFRLNKNEVELFKEWSLSNQEDLYVRQEDQSIKLKPMPKMDTVK